MADIEFEEVDDDYFQALVAAEEAAKAARARALTPNPSPAPSKYQKPQFQYLQSPKPAPVATVTPLNLRVLLSYYGDGKIAVKILQVKPESTPYALPKQLTDIFAQYGAIHHTRDLSAVRESAHRLRMKPLLSYSDKLILIPLKHHGDLVQAFKNKVVADFQPIPSWVLDLLRQASDASRKPAPVDFSKLSAQVRNSILPFQRVGIESAIQRGGKILLADDMGLGKSIQALGIASFYRDQWPLLIIVPASLRQVWSDQIFQWYQDITPDDVTIVMSAKNAVFKKTPIAIVSYELVGLIGSSQFKFGVVIVDESHSLKNPKAKRTIACKPVISGAKRVILLSGTPALSRPSELFPQLNAMRPDLFRGFGNFGNRYCNPVVKAGFTSYDGCDNVEELFAVLRETVMIRRLKSNVLSELPPKKRVKIAVAVSKEQQEMIDHVTETLVESRANEGHTKSFEQLRMVIELFNDSGRAKLPQVLEHIRSFLIQNPTEKVIVFAHHRDVLLAIESLCRAMRAGSIRIDGSTEPSKRYDLVKMFNGDSSVRVAILSMTAAGVGLTLTSACQVIFAELFWNPGTLLQCEDRAHRIGQKRPVTVDYIIAKDTFDEQLWELIEKKMGILGTIFDGVLDSLGAENAQGQDEEEAHKKADVDIPVDDSLLQWILQKAFSWEERRKKTEQRAARRAAVDADTEPVFFEPNTVEDVEMLEYNDDDTNHLHGMEQEHVDQSLQEEAEIEIEESGTPPEYIPEQTAHRLSSFAFKDDKSPR